MTKSAVPSAMSIGVLRIFEIVTVLPVRLRAALTPSAMMVEGFTRLRSLVEPDLATLDLVIVRPLVQPALAAHLMLEMLDRIGDESLLAGNAGVLERGIEDAAGRADERLAGEVFLVARLFADQHEIGPARAFARHRLGGIPIERATPAIGLGLRQLLQGFDGLFGDLVHGWQKCPAGILVHAWS